MSKFAHLSQLDVSGKTAWMDLDDIEGTPRLCIRYAGQSNSGYYNALLKRSGGRSRKVLTGQMDVQMIVDSLDDDRELFPMHVITGWEGVKDMDGNDVPFTRSACAEFCAALPDWIFDKIRNFASMPHRFLAPGEEPAPDAEELGGN